MAGPVRLSAPHRTICFPTLLALGGVSSSTATAQWQPLVTGTTVSLRGLSIVHDSVVWASGQRGTIIRSVDGGSTWAVESIPGAARLDVRAVHARSALVAHAAATAGRIWRTTDGGRNWSLRYQAADTGVFLDAIAFFDDMRGLALGDPIAGRFLILRTDDGGGTWREASMMERPEAESGEAAFAASGSSLVTLGPRAAWLGSGGRVAHVFRSTNAGRKWVASSVPLAGGTSSQGVFSLAFASAQRGVAVGGDYAHPDSTRSNSAVTFDGGRTWRAALTPPRGYRSGVAVLSIGRQVTAVAVGPTGTELSFDGGLNWSPFDTTGFNAVQITGSGVAIAVGAAGRAGRTDLRRAVPARP